MSTNGNKDNYELIKECFETFVAKSSEPQPCRISDLNISQTKKHKKFNDIFT